MLAKIMAGLGRTRKANGVIVAGALAWAAMVVASPSHAITSSEWLGLGGYGAAALTAYGLTNDPPLDSTKAAQPTATVDWQSPPIQKG